jgi:hypothetical protein
LRKTLTALVAVFAIGLAGCARTPDNANTQTYPQEAIDNFVDTCTATANKARPGSDAKQNRTNCQCIVDNLQKVQKLPYDRKSGDDSFKDADKAITSGKGVPASVDAALKKAEQACAPDGK